MRKFTIRDVNCERIMPCDNGDVITLNCVGERLFLYPERKYNGKPSKVKFNLRLSKGLTETLSKEL